MPDLTARTPATTDAFNLERFVIAQRSTYDAVRSELRAGHKTSHWIWFIFPQLRGLGFSATAQRYGINSLDEARAYLAHPVLGARLDECTRLVLAIHGRSLNQILGSPDDLKFRSSMTLFALAAADGNIFVEALAKCCGGQQDAATLKLLGTST